ncbi:unnamed protein product [Lasius platythorax]|uniref:Uncharacterized protein n=1 Tax=Lasius platythorax TaxID=488582 RepID=A0AAV2MXL3_9HYME
MIRIGRATLRLFRTLRIEQEGRPSSNWGLQYRKLDTFIRDIHSASRKVKENQRDSLRQAQPPPTPPSGDRVLVRLLLQSLPTTPVTGRGVRVCASDSFTLHLKRY